MTFSTNKTELAKLLSVSRQSLYYRRKRQTKDEELKKRIRGALRAHPAYGYRTVALHLGINKKCVQRVMQTYDLRPKILPKKNVTGRKTFVSEQRNLIPNRIKTICPLQPNVLWAGDFTKLWFHGHVVHLATIIDLFTREIIAWQAGTHHTRSLILDVLRSAKRKRRRTAHIFHTDQGSEYTSQECMEWLILHDIFPSWSTKGKPWQNGIQESFYKTFKLEFGSPNQYASLPALLEAIGIYMHYYNTKRIHSSLKMTPKEYCKTKKWN